MENHVMMIPLFHIMQRVTSIIDYYYVILLHNYTGFYYYPLFPITVSQTCT